MSYFVHEVEFDLYYGDASWTLPIRVSHKDAVIERVHSRTNQSRDRHGTLPSVTKGVLFVRDKDDPSSAGVTKNVIVVRRSSARTEIPKECARLVGVFPSDGGRHQWLVFLSRDPAKPLPLGTGSTPPEASSPPQPSSFAERPGSASSTARRAQSQPTGDDALYQLGEDPQTSPPQKPKTPPRSEAP
jgi:hypothetical protein